MNSNLINQDGDTGRISVNVGDADQGALRRDRQSAERIAARRYLGVVAAEARRLRHQLRSPELLSTTEAPSPPAEPRGVEGGASPSTRASI